jgi:CubicO group peptidase (beta-lactamase class C family)
VLNHGAWQGRQVVPADWIDAATSSPRGGPQLPFYGYQFWLGYSPFAVASVAWAAAKGRGGQRIYSVPSLDLAVVVLCGLYGDPSQGSVPRSVLNDFVLPATRGW